MTLQDVIRLQQSGRIGEALLAARRLARKETRNADLFLFLGMLQAQSSQIDKAAESFRRAVQIRPDFLEARYNLAYACNLLNRHADAVEHYRAVLAKAPNNLDALNNLASSLHKIGRRDEAVEAYRALARLSAHYPLLEHNLSLVLFEMGDRESALEQARRAEQKTPASAEVFLNSGNILIAMDRDEEALQAFDRAQQLAPADFQVTNNRAAALRKLGRFPAAIEAARSACVLKPESADAWHNLGLILHDAQQFSEAASVIEKSIGLDARRADYHYSLGRALGELDKTEDAIAAYGRSVAIKDDCKAFNNRGALFEKLRKLDDALADYERAIALEPEFPEVWNNKGVLLAACRRIDEAFACYDRALELRPDYADTHVNLAYLQLFIGDFEKGWTSHEWRIRRTETALPMPQGVQLSATDNVSGKRVYVFAEQGLGDTFMFCRYIALLQGRGAHVLFASQPAIRAMLKSLPTPVEFVDPDEVPAFDFHIMSMSLPLIFGTRLDTVPAHVPYLHAETARIAQWSERLGSHGFKIGICWQGNPAFKYDHNRSFTPHEFAPLASLPNVRLISLLKGSVPDGLPEGLKIEHPGEDFDSGADAFLDTAAVMAGLDLVVTSDTSIAHLAGALGVRTFVALSYTPEWRWLAEGDRSPWYPTIRLFRQGTPGDWSGVFNEIRLVLENELASSSL